MPAPDRPRVVRLGIDRLPLAHLGRPLVDRHGQDGGRLDLLLADRPQRLPAAREQPLEEAPQPRDLLLCRHRPRLAEQHHRPVVDGMAECRAGEDEAVEMGDGQAHLPTLHLAQEAARRRPVPEDALALAPLEGRRHMRRAVDHIGDMAQRRRVDDLVDPRSLVGAALVVALDARAPRGAQIPIRHVCSALPCPSGPSPHFSPGSWSARCCPGDRVGTARSAMWGIGPAP